MDNDDVYNSDEEYDSDNDYYDDQDMDVHEDTAGPMGGEKGKDGDPEYCEYTCLDTQEVERVLNESVAALVDATGMAPSLAKSLLHCNNWDIQKVHREFILDRQSLLHNCHLEAEESPITSQSSTAECTVCCRQGEQQRSMSCGHGFCISCWRNHVETRLSEGVSTKIECMQPGCPLFCPSALVVSVLEKASSRAKYERFVFSDHVASHPQLRPCVGKDCSVVISTKTQKAKRVTCRLCKATFCVQCGGEYHAPTSCEIIKKWLAKCADDSETANYISAHTKDCPQCHACIEKNGGCNHICCVKCKHHFCWMCFGDWKTHGSEYYECSRYKENPSVAQEANNVKARRALEKYLHYYERFDNHSKSLRLEEELREKIKAKIDSKVNSHEGTWIDWQYLHDAATLLTRCRYTLQYTYPFAYYMDSGSRKDLFEYQQAQLEKEIEELSWKVERAETTDRGDLEAQMHVAERKRRTLLCDFF